LGTPVSTVKITLITVQSRFAETRFAEALTLTLNPNFGESGFGETGFGESGRHLDNAVKARNQKFALETISESRLFPVLCTPVVFIPIYTVS